MIEENTSGELRSDEPTNEGSTKKFAYLIIAHKNDLTFKTLLRMLDDARNDIFVHMDSKNKSYDPNEMQGMMKHANLYHSERTSVQWGGIQWSMQSCFC